MNVIQELNRVKKIVYYLQRKVIDGVGNLLSALSDVDISTPLDGQVLTWDSVLNKWVNAEPTGGSGSGGGGGTVTSVAALTLGTTGTDLSSTVANATTTPVITLQVPDASATARGVITTGNQTIAGVKTFSSFPITPSSAPSTDYQTANKKYVDDKTVGHNLFLYYNFY